MSRWKLTIEYVGTDYAGWQRQEAGIKTVQETVEDAIFAFCQKRLTIHVAGRTDAGVHAKAQIAHFDLDYTRPLTGSDLTKALNAHLIHESVAILRAEKVADDFHSRFQAINKLYTYRVVVRPSRPVSDYNRVWHRKNPAFDVAAMREASLCLLGHHDFTTFRSTDCQADSPIRTLDRLEIVETQYDDFGGRLIEFHLEARSFLHHQVRNIVGTLAKVGAGKWPVNQVKEALDGRDRTLGGPTAPAEGLWLVRVDYPQ
jgi:tRNA pseudouridine38-40 synthase